MILTKAMIDRAMNLVPADIDRLLNDNGYEGDKVITVAFVGYNDSTGSFVYNATYHDDETMRVEDTGIYVRYNKLFQLIADC